MTGKSGYVDMVTLPIFQFYFYSISKCYNTFVRVKNEVDIPINGISNTLSGHAFAD